MLKTNSKILFQGDSITDAGRFEESVNNNCLGEGYPMFVAKELEQKHAEQKITVINRGVSGNRVVDLLARWNFDAIHIKPDVLSILIGVNDVWRKYSSENENNTGDFIANDLFKKVYDIILEDTFKNVPTVEVVLCAPFVLNTGAPAEDYEDWRKEIDLRIETVKNLAKKYDTKFLDLQEEFYKAEKNKPADFWLSDGVHPTKEGHELICNAWLKLMN